MPIHTTVYLPTCFYGCVLGGKEFKADKISTTCSFVYLTIDIKYVHKYAKQVLKKLIAANPNTHLTYKQCGWVADQFINSRITMEFKITSKQLNN